MVQNRRNSADGAIDAVRARGHIQPETLEHLLALLAEKTAYPHHVTVEIQTGAVLKTIDNESDAQETIRRLMTIPNGTRPMTRDAHAFIKPTRRK